MKKLIIGLLVIGLLVVCGCAPSYSPPTNTPPTTPSDGGTTVLPNEPPVDRTWISPGKVQVGNFYPGARAEWTLLVHNGNDTAASFLIAYRYPDHVEEGYIKPASEVQDWVIIADPWDFFAPVIAPKETKEILITLVMPEDAAVFAPKWEFWISVKDTTQTGMVVTELCSRWLVQMR
jgi:hypothetical protein